ncbi:TPA: oligoribonuclease [Vibrio parahaemolyticus]|uniref:oligoribonuclease n=1 Tax=Vibrio campbellii TaxID=680 RepID=UPI001F087FD2|nr:oligoribonuclease [Vibrio campbellii]UMM06780.1 oligoribonuclease [Vibrio campbellii]
MTNTNSQSEIKIGWTDIETGGLDGKLEDGTLGMETYPILEVAMHITDGDLNIIDGEGFRVVIHHPDDVIAKMDPWALEKHSESGLLDEVRASTTTLEQAEQLALEHLRKHEAIPYDRKAKTGTLMGGNSIKLDRNYLNCQMPELDNYFHYRQADISAVALFVREWRPDVEASVNKKYLHQALPDIRESIMEAKVYKERLFRDDCVVSDTVDVHAEINFLSQDMGKIMDTFTTDLDDHQVAIMRNKLAGIQERLDQLAKETRLA